MRNAHASEGLAEDLIRSFVQVGCAEVHAKTLYEKANAELENGIIDIEDPEVVSKQMAKMDEIQNEISALAQLRRELMLKLYNMFDGDQAQWCMVKHLGIGAYTLFEAYQASDQDPELLHLSIEANKAFIRAMSAFLGMEIVDCAACFSDALKALEAKGE